MAISPWAAVRNSAQPDAPPPDMGPWAPMTPELPPAMTLGSQPRVTEDPIAQNIENDQQRLQDVRHRIATPWGAPGNHDTKMGKVAHVFSQIGNIAGNIVAPNVMANIPGTQMGMKAEEAGLTNRLNKELEQGNEEESRSAQTAHTQAETPEVAPNAASHRTLEGAQAAHLNRETEQIGEPGPPEIHDTPQGLMLIDKNAGTATPVTANGVPIGPKLDTTIAKGIISHMDGKPHAYMVDKQGNKIADLGVDYERPITVNNISPGSNDDLVKGIAEYRIAPPNPRTAQGAAILREVAKLNPTYDVSQYEAQVANRKNLTSGKGALVINALNTVSQHLDDAERNMPHNTAIPAFNTIKNIAGTAMGQAPTKKWDVDADAIGGEWSKLVSGGVATEGELNHIKHLLNNADSPKGMRDAISEIRALTEGKLEGIQKQYGAAAIPAATRGIESIPGQGGTVQMKAPDGTVSPVPADRVEHYKSLGATVVK